MDKTAPYNSWDKHIPEIIGKRVRERTHEFLRHPTIRNKQINKQLYIEVAASMKDYGVTPEEVLKVHRAWCQYIKEEIETGEGNTIIVPFIGQFKPKDTGYQDKALRDQMPDFIKEILFDPRRLTAEEKFAKLSNPDKKKLRKMTASQFIAKMIEVQKRMEKEALHETA